MFVKKIKKFKFNTWQSLWRLLSPLPVTNPACTRRTFTSVLFAIYYLYQMKLFCIAPKWVNLEKSVSFKACLLLRSCLNFNLEFWFIGATNSWIKQKKAIAMWNQQVNCVQCCQFLLSLKVQVWLSNFLEALH